MRRSRLYRWIIRMIESCTPNDLKGKCAICGVDTLSYRIDYDDRIWCLKCIDVWEDQNDLDWQTGKAKDKA